MSVSVVTPYQRPVTIYSILESAKLRTLRTKNVLTCQRALCAYVLTCQHVLRAYMLTCKYASFDATIFSFTAIVAEVVHTVVGKASEFNYCLSSVT